MLPILLAASIRFHSGLDVLALFYIIAEGQAFRTTTLIADEEVETWVYIFGLNAASQKLHALREQFEDQRGQWKSDDDPK